MEWKSSVKLDIYSGKLKKRKSQEKEKRSNIGTSTISNNDHTFSADEARVVYQVSKDIKNIKGIYDY